MSTLKVNTIQDASGSNASTSEQIAQGRAKVWVNFNGTGTVAIRDSFNTSSITDHATGNYSVNFSSAMSDTNYAVSALAKQNDSTSGGFCGIVLKGQTLANTYSTTFFRLQNVGYGSGNLFDAVATNVVVFGDQ